ncbi:ABC transporter ATP-binding protein [Methanomassiliicoccus luminyensis]|jgi:ABC-2 type transport system ATP-binding protein|uniref:ABC transporter ATP-binding protein n=1 Tax=Methanomassiliicoccus luminyensis TaxID=1080712 RepID=UPI00036C9B50|nr:ABC transporter ATP-binding protein [Methanomassiliicoccus luminyensis]
MTAVEVKDLVKNFGDFQAVKGASFSVDEGEVFGLIGPNGAGKTTTMRMMSTLLEISGGSINLFGYDVKEQTDEVRRIISYLPEEAGAYKNLTGRQYLSFIGKFFAEGKEFEDILERGIKIANLGERIDDKVETYSKGMTRRLLVGRALMFRPRLAILDELTSGLDVINAQKVRNTVKDTTKDGTTIIVSSHNMLEVELICDRIALVNDGRVVEQGTPNELKKKYDASNIEDVFVRVVG